MVVNCQALINSHPQVIHRLCGPPRPPHSDLDGYWSVSPRVREVGPSRVLPIQSPLSVGSPPYGKRLLGHPSGPRKSLEWTLDPNRCLVSDSGTSGCHIFKDEELIGRNDDANGIDRWRNIRI